MVMREDRKEQILDKAVEIFAEWGYYKTTTAQVAKAVGVTQPYIFHFFQNKEELFKAVIDKAVQRLFEAFSVVESPGDHLVDMMGLAFNDLMQSHRNEILMVMQAYTISEPEIRNHVKEKFQMLHESISTIFERGGVSNAEVAASQFIGMGLMITISEVLELPQLRRFKDNGKYGPHS